MESNCQDSAMAAGDPAPAGDAAAPAQLDRRMHLRAYNHWASLLGRRHFPAVADLANGAYGEIAPHSVLLDVSGPSPTPAIAYLGDQLAQECGAPAGSLLRLADAPEGSLLGRVARHYRLVLANRAPTGFEAEFTGLRGKTVLYRGILLPFSSDDVTIDFVLAVINWKEVAEAPARPLTADEPSPASRRAPSGTALTDWADGPGSDLGTAPEPVAAEPSHADDEATLPAPLAENLRALPLQPFTALPHTGAEFALAIVRRAGGQPPALLGEVPHDPALIEQAAHRLAR